jgi:hypothetical protein
MPPITRVMRTKSCLSGGPYIVFIPFFSYYAALYGWKQRPLLALTAVLGAPPLSHPASAC